MELFRAPSAVHDVAGRSDSPARTLGARTRRPLASTFVVNLAIPAADGVYQVTTPTLTLALTLTLNPPSPSQLVLYFGVFEEEEIGVLSPSGAGATPAAAKPSAGGRLLARFVAGTDAFRSARLKILPSVAEGPWLVKTGVGNRPAILGKSLRQRFHSGEGYFEVCAPSAPPPPSPSPSPSPSHPHPHPYPHPHPHPHLHTRRSVSTATRAPWRAAS